MIFSSESDCYLTALLDAKSIASILPEIRASYLEELMELQGWVQSEKDTHLARIGYCEAMSKTWKTRVRHAYKARPRLSRADASSVGTVLTVLSGALRYRRIYANSLNVHYDTGISVSRDILCPASSVTKSNPDVVRMRSLQERD